MKKYLLFAIAFVCVSIGAWAETSVSLSDGTLTITTTEAGTLSSQTFSDADKAATTIVLVGKFSSADLEAINRNHGFTSVKTVNMKNAEFPKQSNGNTNYYLFAADLPQANNYNDCYAVVGGTYYESGESNGSFVWHVQNSYSDGTQVSNRYATLEEAPTPTENGKKMVVGGTLYKPVHDWNSNPQTHTWQEVGAGDNNDWTQMAFGGWEGLETIILPDNFNVESGKNYNNFYGNNKSTLKRIERGDSYAIIGSSNNNYTAEIYCADDDRANMKAIVGLDNFVTQDANITYANPNDHDYITWNDETGVYDVHVTSAGSLKSKFEKLLRDAGQNALEGKVFRFDSECTDFTAEDLQALAHANGPYVNVDLYNVTATTEIETAIHDALLGNGNGVNALANNQHYKGLLLPRDPQQIGTALIANTGSSSPISDFIAYNNGSTTTAHIYNTSTASADAYAAKLTALKGLLDAHTQIAQNTSVYLISTNSKTPIANVEDIKGNSTTASIVHTYNNEMVNPDSTNPTKPCIEVIPAKAGDYATLNAATNMRNTPNTDVLKFKGAINATDIAAINSFTQTHWDSTTNSYVENDPKVYNGPRVLDLSEVTTEITKDLLDNLSNPEIEYIILPAGMEAPVVGDYANLTNLKCIISSDDSSKEGERVLNAYVREAGSLAEARCLATGNDDGGGSTFKPTGQGLTKVKLSGNLNHNDISTKGDTSGLKDEYTTVTSIDLSGAYFANVDDMRLGNEGDGRPGAGFNQSSVLTEVILPTKMTEIPSYCLYGIKSLHNLHIPYKYTKIGWAAFWESGIDHITTEDKLNGALVDNGPKTYTLSAAITELGAPNQQESIAVFPQTVGVTDVYCLATTAPVCYAHTFHADITYGQGGMNDGIYCREKYQKDSKVIAVLHFPSLESYKNATGSEDGYANMVSSYTDPTRAYSKKDQTGAVDANGNPLVWPDQGELLGSRNMALAGYIWEDYPNLEYQNGGDAHLISIGNPEGDREAFYPSYVGWHEFVLSMATYVDPEEIIEDEKIVREYVETDWYTFCIPFDMTISQVQEMLGVPASTDKVICKLNGQEVTTAIMPDIRQLSRVTREKGVGTANNHVRLYLTNNLWNGTKAQYLDFDLVGKDADNKPYANNGQQAVDASTDAKPDRCLVGGRPYVIKAYRRAGDAYKIKGQNLGKYIMTRYGDEFGKDASCVENGLYEQLYNGAGNGLVTLRFAIPYENHKVRAVKYGEDAAYLEYSADGTAYHYNYTLVGQYWQQPLPQYCFYMSKGKWYRYTNTSNNYTWDPYKCIIMATPEIDDTSAHPMSGKYRDNANSVYPTVVSGTDDLLEENFSLAFLNGRDDDDFDQPYAANAKYTFCFDDGIEEIGDEDYEITAIKMIDGEELISIPENGNVYNMAGQFVGKGLAGLPKGLYIVNGKKYIVK